MVTFYYHGPLYQMTKLEMIYLLLVSHITEKIEAQRKGISVLYHTNTGKSTL